MDYFYRAKCEGKILSGIYTLTGHNNNSKVAFEMLITHICSECGRCNKDDVIILAFNKL